MRASSADPRLSLHLRWGVPVQPCHGAPSRPRAAAGRLRSGRTRARQVGCGYPRNRSRIIRYDYRNILAATDFSPTGREAVRVAMDLARRTGATLHIVHVKAPLKPALPLSRNNRELVKKLQREQSAEARLRLQQLVPKAGPLKVRTRLLNGTVPSATLLAHSERVAADLLVLGRRGQSALADLLIGSTADGVTRQASMPVLLIPPRPR